MKPNQTRTVKRIADAIVDLVNRKGGPVLLREVEEQVPSFAAAKDPSRQYFHTQGGGESTIWSGMTEEGYRALREVLNTRQVAVEYVRRLDYLAAGFRGTDPNWVPIALIPARMANLSTPVWNVRVSTWVQQEAAKDPRYQRISASGSSAAPASWRSAA
jgi:hypothetical protein